jgi:hypothetical protein
MSIQLDYARRHSISAQFLQPNPFSMWCGLRNNARQACSSCFNAIIFCDISTVTPHSFVRNAHRILNWKPNREQGFWCQNVIRNRLVILKFARGLMEVVCGIVNWSELNYNRF